MHTYEIKYCIKVIAAKKMKQKKLTQMTSMFVRKPQNCSVYAVYFYLILNEGKDHNDKGIKTKGQIISEAIFLPKNERNIFQILPQLLGQKSLKAFACFLGKIASEII